MSSISLSPRALNQQLLLLGGTEPTKLKDSVFDSYRPIESWSRCPWTTEREHHFLLDSLLIDVLPSVWSIDLSIESRSSCCRHYCRVVHLPFFLHISTWVSAPSLPSEIECSAAAAYYSEISSVFSPQWRACPFATPSRQFAGQIGEDDSIPIGIALAPGCIYIRICDQKHSKAFWPFSELWIEWQVQFGSTREPFVGICGWSMIQCVILQASCYLSSWLFPKSGRFGLSQRLV